MIKCTDKVAVRDYVAEKIGCEYLKPILQICNSFDEIDFDKLPNSFVIKCNNGCKWQYIIKNKEEFLKNKPLFDTVKRNITGWLEQEYWCWGGFEMQYKEIKTKILIEVLMWENVKNIQAYCFRNCPKYIIKFHSKKEITIYNENLNINDNIFEFDEKKINVEADNVINQIYVLSKDLSQDFTFVRVDWMIYKNNLYFEELTFTPYSGFHMFKNKNNLKLGNNIKL